LAQQLKAVRRLVVALSYQKDRGMNIRAASVLFAFVLGFNALPARAQGPNAGPPPNYQQLASQLAALQARVSKLEGNITANDLAGTYSLMVLGTSMTALRPGSPVVNATISTSAIRATLTLNADGTGSASSVTCEGSTLTQGPWSMTGGDCGSSESATDVTWTYADGVITVTFVTDNEAIPLNVAAGGRLLVNAFAPFHPSDPSSDQLLFIATRLK
jgi:hypothetical protein